MAGRDAGGDPRRQAENTPKFAQRTPPRVDDATNGVSRTHAIGRGTMTTADMARRAAEPGSERAEADANAADRGKLDTSQQFAENPLTAGIDRMQAQRDAGHDEHGPRERR